MNPEEKISLTLIVAFAVLASITILLTA